MADTDIGIIQEGASIPIVDTTLSTVGKTTYSFRLPTAKFIASLWISSITDCMSIEVYSNNPSDESERKLVLDMGVYDKTTKDLVIMESDICMSECVVEIVVGGSTTLRLDVKPVVSSTETDKHELTNTLLNDILLQQKRLVTSLTVNNKNQMKMLNHLRYITDINADEGDEF